MPFLDLYRILFVMFDWIGFFAIYRAMRFLIYEQRLICLFTSLLLMNDTIGPIWI
jgi:hypothetical protein